MTDVMKKELKEEYSKLPFKQRLFYGFIDSKFYTGFLGPAIYYGNLIISGPYPKDFFDEPSD